MHGTVLLQPGDKNEAAGDSHPLAMYDDNGNGRITCKEARDGTASRRCAGIIPLTGTCAMATGMAWSASEPCLLN